MQWSYSVLADAVHGIAPVTATDSHQTVQCAAFAVQAGALGLDLRPAVKHDLRTEREILHQHPPVVQHLPLAFSADRMPCVAQEPPITNTINNECT